MEKGSFASRFEKAGIFVIVALFVFSNIHYSMGTFYAGISAGDHFSYTTTLVSGQSLHGNVTFNEYNSTYYNATAEISWENGTLADFAGFLNDTLNGTIPGGVIEFLFYLTGYLTSGVTFTSGDMPTDGLYVLSQEAIEARKWMGILLKEPYRETGGKYWRGRQVLTLDLTMTSFVEFFGDYVGLPEEFCAFSAGLQIDDWFVAKWDAETGILYEAKIVLGRIISDLDWFAHIIESEGGDILDIFGEDITSDMPFSDWNGLVNWVTLIFGGELGFELVGAIGEFAVDIELGDADWWNFFWQDYWWVVLLVTGVGLGIGIALFLYYYKSFTRRNKQYVDFCKNVVGLSDMDEIKECVSKTKSEVKEKKKQGKV